MEIFASLLDVSSFSNLALAIVTDRAGKIEEEKQTLLGAKIKKQKLGHNTHAPSGISSDLDISPTSSHNNLKPSTSFFSNGSKTLSTHKSRKSTAFAVAAPSHDESKIKILPNQTRIINNNQNTQLPAVVESKSHTESSTENLSSTQEQEIPINDNQSIQQLSANLDPTDLTPRKKKPKSKTKEKKLNSEIEPKESYNTSSNVSSIPMSYFELLTKTSGDIQGLKTNIVT